MAHSLSGWFIGLARGLVGRFLTVLGGLFVRGLAGLLGELVILRGLGGLLFFHLLATWSQSIWL